MIKDLASYKTAMNKARTFRIDVHLRSDVSGSVLQSTRIPIEAWDKFTGDVEMAIAEGSQVLIWSGTFSLMSIPKANISHVVYSLFDENGNPVR